MKRAPCENCEERHVGCHAKCEKFAAWRAEVDQHYKKQAGEREKVGIVEEYRAKTIQKSKRHAIRSKRR